MIEFAEKNREDLSSKMHYSKYILELETKEKYKFYNKEI